ncbi:calphotin-like [Nyctibius grandis]|uniref:calphotin-like n=1 Tax=Nyctibius grandis TaxID=48427 RepID=UPI0035BC7D38
MPMDEEENAHSQPADGLPSLQRRRKTDSLVRRASLPSSRVTWEEAVPLPTVSPIPRLSVALGHLPASWPPAAAGTSLNLPALPAAAPVSSADSREMGIVTTASGLRQPVPPPCDARGDQAISTRVARWKPAPHSPAPSAAAAKAAAECFMSEILDKMLNRSLEPSQQWWAQWDQAHGTAVVSPRRAREQQLHLRPRQTVSLVCQLSPYSRATWEEIIPLPASSPLPRLAAAPGQSPASWPPAAAGTSLNLPPLPAAAPVSSADSREMAVVTAASGLQQPVPPPQDTQCTAVVTRTDKGTQQRYYPKLFGELKVRGGQIHEVYKQQQPELTPVEVVRDATSEEDSLEQLAARSPREQEAKAAGVAVLQAPEEEKLVLAKKEEREDKSNKELSQGEDIAIKVIWVNPFVPELCQEPHVGLPDGLSMSTGAAGEALGDTQAASPVPAGPMDVESGSHGLAGAPEAEEHQAPLSPLALEEVEAAAAPVLGEQATAAPVPGEQATAAPVLGEQATAAPVLGEQATAAPVLGEQATAAPVLGKQATAAPVLGEQATAAPVLGEQATAAPVLGEQATAAPVLGEQATAAPVLGEQATAAPVPGEQATAAQAESRAPSPHSPVACPRALQHADGRLVDVLVGKAVLMYLEERKPHQPRILTHKGARWGQAGPCPMAAQPLACRSPSPAGTAAPPSPQPRRRSMFRRALKALRRVFFSCTCGVEEEEEEEVEEEEEEEEEERPAASARRVPDDGVYKRQQPELTPVEVVRDAPCEEESLEQLAAHSPSDQEAEAAKVAVLQAPEEEKWVLAKEEQREDKSNKELCQGEDIGIKVIWVNPLVPELFQDPHVQPQMG